ncbi:Bug family tripartite tricarboxylate transporter substrate binding protein [Falsiroseomonas stagni]|uniref:Tripartite-type tricarboxylate transporter, receptor component TctC n=1 Tax=Falsiroseomonas stagni DSM 19981 TaxID=1123062 RepID=A0A1I3XHM5_9PROT|nr:tripartite tricarboxylate transporter substrate-binding protein [Falsiroseomonas stagni]SFK18556.1 Tripartite-type tricarboxylate transporter, receptor component TctC [Falsiroseomonas stagni DSM 19981]
MKRRALLLATLATPALAQPWTPSRPLRLVVPFAPGGSVDLAARLLAEPLGQRLGQSVVVENRTGAGGAIGADSVAKAAPDGLTLLWGSSGVLSIAAALRGRLPYDPARDFAPVSLVMRAWHGLLASPRLGMVDLPQVLAMARARPGVLNIASGGTGSATHLLAERLKLIAGVDMVHVPYRGSGAVYPDLAAGLVQLMFESLPVALAQSRGDSARLIAVSAPTRTALAPEVPTLVESGVPGFVTSAWFGVLVPVATPDSIRAVLGDAIREVSSVPDFRRRALEAGLEVVGSSAAEFSELLATETREWAEVGARTGIKLD